MEDPAAQRVLFLKLNHPNSAVRRMAFTTLAEGITKLDENPDVEDIPMFVQECCTQGVTSESDPRSIAPLFTGVTPDLLVRLLPEDALVEWVKKALMSAVVGSKGSFD